MPDTNQLNTSKKRIVFKNKCIVDQSWMSDAEVQFRLQADSRIIKTISQSAYFKDCGGFEVLYFQEGVASIVAKITSNSSKVGVYKTILNKQRVEAEVLSYKKYKHAGIATPVIFEYGEIDGGAFYIMEYINAPTYRQLIDENKISLTKIGAYLGNILCQLEKIPTKGFGIPSNEKDGILVANTANLKSHLNTIFNTPQNASQCTDYMRSTDWQNVARQHIQNVTESLDNSSVLGNFDLGPRHVFAADQPILFDPDAELVPRYFSAAFYCTPEMGYKPWKTDVRRTAMQTYVANTLDFDRNIFISALWLLTYRKCNSLLALPSPKRVSRAMHMLKTIEDEDLLFRHVKDIAGTNLIKP